MAVTALKEKIVVSDKHGLVYPLDCFITDKYHPSYINALSQDEYSFRSLSTNDEKGMHRSHCIENLAGGLNSIVSVR